jgi:hypothetical protein
MVNKVLAAYIGIDIIFAATGALILGFSVIVKNTCFDAPTDGNEAARDLLYQQFPFSGKSIWRKDRRLPARS